MYFRIGNVFSYVCIFVLHNVDAVNFGVTMRMTVRRHPFLKIRQSPFNPLVR